jgi:BirA family biotin operon repressor/biotin-[acetyl-CoA-carboxylase] ligase
VTGDSLETWEGRPVEDWRETWHLPRLLIYQRTPSTNDVGRALAESGAPPFTTIIANEQTQGHGRFGRPWIAPRDAALLFTILLPAPAAATMPTASIRLGVATARAIESVIGTSVSLKWPNDVFSRDGRKCAGILCETTAGGTGATALVAGIGINVNQSDADWPTELRDQAVSLCQLAGHTIDRPSLALALLHEIRLQAPLIGSVLDEPTNEDFQRRDILFSRPILVDGKAVGIAAGVAEDGALRVRTRAGERLIWSGTVRIDKDSMSNTEPAEHRST